MADEVQWTWTQIAVALMWRLAPNGTVLTRKDLASLPMDRMLLEERLSDRIEYSWATVKAVEKRVSKLARLGKPEKRAELSQLQGRWQKLAVVLMWKHARDGITLYPGDLSAVPVNLVLLAHGHKEHLEYRFVDRKESEAIAKFEKDNEGRIITEAL